MLSSFRSRKPLGALSKYLAEAWVPDQTPEASQECESGSEVPRFKSDVIAQTSAIIRGFSRLNRRKMDIILMDLQYASALVTPARLADSGRMVSWIAAFAKGAGSTSFAALL